MKFYWLFAAIIIAAKLIVTSAIAADNAIIIQSTTSTQNSGLLDQILPLFEKTSDIKVHVVAVGTGQAIKNSKNCDGDVLLVHAKKAEQKFVAQGYGVKRYDVMYNDFIIIGPPQDKAVIAGGHDAVAALKKIAAAKAIFASRGDDSGTHKKERSLWLEAKIEPVSGGWYREIGSGMGATLNAAIGMGAYTLTDRATWIAFKNKGDFKVMVEGDKALFNQYGVIAVNSVRCPNVKAIAGQKFVEWILSGEGQSAIKAYTRAGQQLFFPNAAPN